MPELQDASVSQLEGEAEPHCADYNLTMSSGRTLKSTNRFNNLREMQTNFLTRVDMAKEYIHEHFEGTGEAAAKTKEAFHIAATKLTTATGEATTKGKERLRVAG